MSSTANIEEVMKFYNLGHKTFETDFSSYMAYAMQELTEGVPIWLKKFLLGPIVN